jgi:predicted enzyme related to lactoylglutathione lyase
MSRGLSVAPLVLFWLNRKRKGKNLMSNADSRGTFVWHDLLTADAAGAKAFYTKVVPWKTQTWDQDASYTMWVGKNGPVGGIGPLGDSGSPHWMPHVSVPDVAATVEEAKELGGRVLKEPTTLPNGGSFAVLADPQGAEFSVYQSATELNGAAAPGAGEFTWHELATSDAKAAMDFYTELLGWEAGPVHDMGPAGLYHLFLHKGNQYGGMYVADNLGGPSWLCYIGVEDAGKAAAAAKAAGGRVLNGPIEVPGGSWVAQVLDSDGAPFAVHEPAKMTHQPAASAPEAKPAKAPKPAKPKAPKAENVTADAAEAPAERSASASTAPNKAAAKPSASKPTAEKAVASKPAAAPAAAKSRAKKAAPAKAGAPAKGKGKKKTVKKAAKKVAAKGKAKAAVKKSAAGKSKGKKTAGKKKSAAKRAAPAKKKAKKKTKATKRR